MRSQRALKGFSQENIALELGVSPKAYSKIENGDTRLTMLRFLEWCQIVKVNPAEFFKAAQHENNDQHKDGL